MTLSISTEEESKLSQPKIHCSSSLSLSSIFIKVVTILSCLVISLLIFDDGSNLLNTSFSSKFVQDKSKNTARPQKKNNDHFNHPLSLKSSLAKIKKTTTNSSSSPLNVSNKNTKEKTATTLLRSDPILMIPAGKDAEDNSHQSSEPGSSTLAVSIETNIEVKSNALTTLSSTTKNEVLTVHNQIPPKIIWLMSFPASGTTFTIDLVKKYSKMTIGKNFGHDRKSSLEGYSIPVHPSFTNGPFLVRKGEASNYVLTKTHCEHQDLAQNHYTFRNQCCSGSRRYPDSDTDKVPLEHSCKHGFCGEGVQYDIEIVKKIVHLVRDPFTNIVSRFNREHRQNATYLKQLHSSIHDYHDAFKSWCREKDEKVNHDIRRYYGKGFPSNVPCGHEFFEYIDWHNKAFALTEELGVPSLVFHYENYKKNFSGALHQLGSFLEQNIEEYETNFLLKSYSFMYSEKERSSIMQWFKEISTISTWNSIKGYFGIDVWPKVAWLMSFPASGTTFTLNVVKSVSNRTVAKNSAFGNNRMDELGYSVTPHESYTRGPFLEDKAMDIPEKYVFTKTHCEFSVISSLYVYRNECVKAWGRFPQNDPTKTPEDCRKGFCHWETYYDPNIVQKAVHLIRNPLENVIARFNNLHKRNKTFVNFTHSHPMEYKQLFHEWCDRQDRAALVKQYYDDVPNVTCVSELFRYVQWHNHAILLVKDMNISTMILHYEDYAKNLNNTIENLFSFLEYDMVTKPLPFFPHDYSFMYTVDEKDSIKNWVKVLASKNLWNLLEHYFY